MTHQKRTMDAADTLYGVSMGGDGVSRVVSRKLGQPATSRAARPRPVAEPAPRASRALPTYPCAPMARTWHELFDDRRGAPSRRRARSR